MAARCYHAPGKIVVASTITTPLPVDPLSAALFARSRAEPRSGSSCMSIYQHLLFLACVALATYAQTMTGFAFGLVLLGLSGVFQLASVSEVANVVSVLSLVNAGVTLLSAKS